MVTLSFTLLMACQSPAAETKSNLATTEQTTSSTLTLEQAEQQLKENGSTFVDTIEKASRLTGYPVTMPAYVPDGFTPRVITNDSAFYIYNIGFSSPRPLSQLPEFPYDVQVTFTQTQGASLANEPFFMITQSRNKIQGVGGSTESVDIGGNPGKKSLIPAGDKSPARLGLSWNDGTMYYVMEGTLVDPLDEATLIKIASSMDIP